MEELVIKKCLKCGAQIKVMKDCTCDNCGIMCCEEPMKEINFNSVDAAAEKHIPIYEKQDNKIVVTVNHVMEEQHFIEWVCYKTDKTEMYIYFTDADEAKTIFPYEGEGVIYASCNKHGIWKTNID